MHKPIISPTPAAIPHRPVSRLADGNSSMCPTDVKNTALKKDISKPSKSHYCPWGTWQFQPSTRQYHKITSIDIGASAKFALAPISILVRPVLATSTLYWITTNTSAAYTFCIGFWRSLLIKGFYPGTFGGNFHPNFGNSPPKSSPYDGFLQTCSDCSDHSLSRAIVTLV